MRALRGRAGGAPPVALGVAGSATLHVLVAAVTLAAARAAPRPKPPPVYRVDLVAAPRPSEPAATPALAPPEPARAAGRTAPAPAAPRERDRPRSSPVASSAPARTNPQPAPAQPVVPAPGTGGAGADPATVRTEGVEFPFPGYLRNLVAQVYRRWRPPQGNQTLEAEIFFIVHRDGSISSLRIVRRSGSYAFDLEAQGAVEAAARAGSFGPLPDGYAADVLPVSFFFTPGGIR